MKRILPILLLLASSGCLADPERLRPVSLELTTQEGHWRLDGVRGATLELEDWSIRIVESGVATVELLPVLERLIIEIVNDSVDKPLILEPQEITIMGFAGEYARLGPPRRVVLRFKESAVVTYTPGLRAPMLPHPFVLRVTVFRDAELESSQAVTVRLY